MSIAGRLLTIDGIALTTGDGGLKQLEANVIATALPLPEHGLGLLPTMFKTRDHHDAGLRREGSDPWAHQQRDHRRKQLITFPPPLLINRTRWPVAILLTARWRAVPVLLGRPGDSTTSRGCPGRAVRAPSDTAQKAEVTPRTRGVPADRDRGATCTTRSSRRSRSPDPPRGDAAHGQRPRRQ